MEQPTEEEIKQACNMLKAAKQHGFITHLHASGKSAAEIEKLHARYLVDDAKREETLQGLRTAILGEEA